MRGSRIKAAKRLAWAGIDLYSRPYARNTRAAPIASSVNRLHDAPPIDHFSARRRRDCGSI